MMKVKPVPVLVPANDLFGLVIPSCGNTISPIFETAYLVCPSDHMGCDLLTIDPETSPLRSRLVKLFVGEQGLYAAPCFRESDFGCWKPGGAYIIVPVASWPTFGCGYKFSIRNTAVPLYDFWDKAMEPEEFPWPIF